MISIYQFIMLILVSPQMSLENGSNSDIIAKSGTNHANTQLPVTPF